jgi:hypothetical protein
MADICHIVAGKRSNIYDDPDYRKRCRDTVMDEVYQVVYYNTGGILKQVDPFAHDTMVFGLPTKFCSQWVDHFYEMNSGGKFNIAKGTDDHVVPFDIQRCALLSDVQKINGIWQWREMDTVLTTSDSIEAEGIRFKTAGVEHTFDQTVATHAGIIIMIEGRLFVAEMLETSCINSIQKYMHN